MFSKMQAASTESVKLSGTHIPCKFADMPTMIWLPELVEPAENFH
jgi:hypothetical protein